jgi:hypothetical protein
MLFLGHCRRRHKRSNGSNTHPLKSTILISESSVRKSQSHWDFNWDFNWNFHESLGLSESLVLHKFIFASKRPLHFCHQTISHKWRAIQKGDSIMTGVIQLAEILSTAIVQNSCRNMSSGENQDLKLFLQHAKAIAVGIKRC